MKKILPFLLLICAANGFSQSYSSKMLQGKAITLRRFMEQNHIQPISWTDTTSNLLFTKWIETLDDDKMLFQQSDINELSAYKNKLDDELLNKSWGFFDASIKIYKRRLLQTDSMAKKICSSPFDFSKPEKLSWPAAAYVQNDYQMYVRWQQYYKWKMLNSLSDNDTLAKSSQLPAAFSNYEKNIRAGILRRHNASVYTYLQPSPEFEKELEEKYLNAICWCYDPHSDYFTLSKKQEFSTSLSGFEFSTGLNVDQNENGEWEVVQLQPGGPAWNSGELHKGDIITAIKEGNKPEQVLADMNEEQVYELLQGTGNEALVITFKTKAGTSKTVTLKKEKFESEEAVVKSYVIGNTTKIGYINLPDFYSQMDEADEENMNGCANDMAKEIVKLNKDSIQGLVLDLRYNGGGSIWEALQLAGIFIDYGTMTGTKSKDGYHFLKDPNRGTIYDGPMIVMINGTSASASELVSSVLQDYKRAIIVGGTSFGKGTSQVILPLDTFARRNNTGAVDFVKVTSGRFYRVDGNTVQWKGVEPDIKLPDYFVLDKYKERGEPTALKPDIGKPAIYNPMPQPPVSQLQKLSEERVKNVSIFKAISALADLFKQTEKGVEVPLQWKDYLAFEKKFAAAYDVIEKQEKVKAAEIPVSNNSFDKRRYSINVSETNNRYLENVSGDAYIAECYYILLDMLKGKN